MRSMVQTVPAVSLVAGFWGQRTMYTMRRTLIVSFIAACSLLPVWVGPARAAAPQYAAGTYAWVLPAVAGDGADQPAAVQFPFNNTSGYAGVVYTVFGVEPGANGDGRTWSPPTARNTITNLVPAFCVQQGAIVRYDTHYAVPGTTTIVSMGPFSTAGATVTGSGPGLTATPTQVAADLMAEIPVNLDDTLAFGTPVTFTAVEQGGVTLTQIVTPADPYQVKDWSASRAAAPANMAIAAWIAAHASTYSDAGLRGTTYAGDSDHVASTVMTPGNAANESIEAAAAQLAIWQVLAGKSVVAGVPEANSPIADYVANSPHPLAGQTRGTGGTFTASPTQTDLDNTVPDRAKELVIRATGTGVLGGSDDEAVIESAHTPVITVSAAAPINGVAQLTVTGTRTSSSGVSEPLAGVSVSLTGADFDTTTAGVQSGSVTLSASGTASISVAAASSAQTVTARADVSVPAGALLAVASDNGPNSTPNFALQQLITARATTAPVQASAVVAGADGSTTTTPPDTSTPVTSPVATPGTGDPTVPDELPYSGPFVPLAVIAGLILCGGIGLLVRRRLIA